MEQKRKTYCRDLHILVSQRQLDILKKLAEAHGLPLSSYIRFALFRNHNLLDNPK